MLEAYEKKEACEAAPHVSVWPPVTHFALADLGLILIFCGQGCMKINPMSTMLLASLKFPESHCLPQDLPIESKSFKISVIKENSKYNPWNNFHLN